VSGRSTPPAAVRPRVGTRVRGFALAQPVSVVVSVVLVLLAIVSGSVRNGSREGLLDLVGAGVSGTASPRGWILTLASVLFAGSLPELIATVLAVLVLVGAGERLMGHGRALVAYVVTGVLATVVGALVQALGVAVGESWALQVAYDSTLHPFTPALGVIMTASAFAGPLTRRRIRVFGFASIVTFLLYDGHPAGLYALVGALAGLALGRVLRPEGRIVDLGWRRSSHHEARVLLSTVVSVTALGPVVTLLTRSPVGLLAPVGRLFRDDAPGRLHGPDMVLLSVLPLITLLVSGAFIRRGRRVAAWTAIAVNLLLAALAALFEGVLPFTSDAYQDLPGHRVERLFISGLSVAVPLAVAVTVRLNLRHLTVRASADVVRRYVGGVVAALVVLSVLYLATGLIGRSRFAPPISVAELLLTVPERFVPVGFVGLRHLGPVPIDLPLRIVYAGVGPVFWLVVLVGLVIAAGDSTRSRISGRRAAVERILRRGVVGHLSHMATWEGNSYWLTSAQDAGVAYRVVGSRAITTGDPLCDPSRVREVVTGFAEWCDDRGLSPVFYSVQDQLGPVFDELGWTTVPVAEETVIRVDGFSMQGKKWQDVRSSLNRASKQGVRAVWTRFVDLRPALARQVEEISEEWVAEKGLPELGFTLGGLDELADRDVALMLAAGPDDRILAVTSWLPTWRDGRVVGWTLDFMRRRPGAMNGVMEFVIASAVLRAQEDLVEFVSLSAAPLATADPLDADSSQTERLLGFLSRTLEPAYGFSALLSFKRKFQPELTPLVMAYPDPLELPAIGTALARAYLPELSLREVPRILRSVV
jgi:lysylphosphatidylglycerol synthetase-like protein (DUF2156 family)